MTDRPAFLGRIRAEMARAFIPGGAEHPVLKSPRQGISEQGAPPHLVGGAPSRPRELVEILRRELAERWRETLERFRLEFERVAGGYHRVARVGEVPAV